MARHSGFWSNFFRATRATYRAQHAGRTFRAWTSGLPRRAARLYARRAMYRAFARFTNRILK
jgi:hypothetical protein